MEKGKGGRAQVQPNPTTVGVVYRPEAVRPRKESEPFMGRDPEKILRRITSTWLSIVCNIFLYASLTLPPILDVNRNPHHHGRELRKYFPTTLLHKSE
jgi:hypothetical protein